MPNSLSPSPTPRPVASSPSPAPPGSRTISPQPLSPAARDFCTQQAEALSQQFFQALFSASSDLSGSGTTLREIEDAFCTVFRASCDRLAAQNKIPADSPRAWDRLAELQREQTPDNM